MPRVLRCRNSNIEEAWAGIMGLPSKVDDTEASVLLRAARKKFNDLEIKPTIVSVEDPDFAGPYWKYRVTWGGGRYLAAFGHRYLTVHFLRSGGDRYSSFASSLAPQLEEWMNVYDDALGSDAREHLVSDVSFGYVNVFRPSSVAFDVSRYFKVGLTVDPGAQRALFSLETTFGLKTDAGIVLTNNLRAETLEDGSIALTTKFVAGKVMTNDTSFADRASLSAAVTESKNAAKDAFFDFATKETHDFLGVELDAAADPPHGDAT